MSEQQDIDEMPDRYAPPTMPPRHLAITMDAKESEFHACGTQRVRAMFGKHRVPHEVIKAITQRCYDLKAGAKTKLRIAFFENNEKAAPKGTLVLAPDRGKVTPTRIELDGKKHEITVEYTAPDETIRVSIRAFLEGFARGKVHLHLEA